MRRSTILAILLTLVIILLVSVTYLGGKLATPNTPSTTQTTIRPDVGLLPLPDAGQPKPIALEYVVDQIPSALIETKGVSSPITIHYIRGNNIDTEGRATKWAFGIRYENQSALLYYDVSGWQWVPWQGEYPGQEIRTGSFTPPKDLVRKNIGILFGSTPLQTDQIQLLELGNGIYTVTLNRQDSKQILLFDATTGALIPSYA
ncbi:MAG: hypothetical protein NTW33_09795 [Methanoregula sp.]|nr:hypothetical protein [Methanoregula sp.]